MTLNELTLTVAASLALLMVAANRRADLGALVSDGTAPIANDPSGINMEQAQGNPLDVLAPLDLSTYTAPPVDTAPDTVQANRAAILQTVRFAEGTAGQDGYRVMFGYRYFDDFSDHPRQPAQFTDAKGRRLWTSAAGAYQMMAVSPLPGGGSTHVNTWDRIKAKLGLPDFSPDSQDAAAIELIAECGALGDVDAGRFEDAISKMRGTWASLPGAGYAQPERSLNALRVAFINAGGTLA